MISKSSYERCVCARLQTRYVQVNTSDYKPTTLYPTENKCMQALSDKANNQLNARGFGERCSQP